MLKIDPKSPEPEKIQQVVEVLQNGGIIVYPTDTIYGIGCDIFNKKAVAKIYHIKRRDQKKPMSIVCSDFKDISQYAIISNQAFLLMKKVLPGAYTFILKAKNSAPKSVVSKNKTLGIRIPDNKVCLEIVKALGHPIVSTSLNISGQEVLTNPAQLSKEMANQIDLIIDGGELEQEASSIIDLTNAKPIVLRPGKGDLSLFI